MNKAERITALVGGKKLSGVTKEFLETCSDAQLTALEADAAKVTTPTPETTPQTAGATTEPVTKDTVADVLRTMSEDDYMKCAPKSIRDLVQSAKDRETAERTSLVGAMKTSQTEFSEEELNSMPLDQLRKLSRVCNVRVAPVDFGGRGVPRTDNTADDQTKAPKAIDMVARIKANRATTSAAS